MLLLAFDTSTPFVTVAVHDSQNVLAQTSSQVPMAHGEQLAPAIDRALKQAGRTAGELTDVAVGVGPGPFTGLRVGVVTALTLASTLQLTAHGRCSLDIVAEALPAAEPFLVATDARRKEVYWARYDATGQRVEGPNVSGPDDLAVQGLPVYGPGAELYADRLRAAPGGSAGPLAANLARMVIESRGESLPLEPLYLRRPDATANTSVKRA